MYVADSEQVHALLEYPILIDWLHASLTGQIPDSQTMMTTEPAGGANRFMTLVGWKAQDLITVKMVGVFPDNLKKRPPQASIQGLVCGFSGETGAPLLVADGEAMTFRKTAADSGLGSKLLARSDARNLLVVGAGGLSWHVVAAHRAARPSLEIVRIWNRTVQRSQELASQLRQEGVAAEAIDDLDAAVAEADIVSCVTMSEQPLVKGTHLKPGAHLDLIGSYLPTMRECDTEAIARGRVFVNTRRGIENAGELVHAVEHGRFRWEDIVADAAELCNERRPGRTGADDITVYKNIGGGQFDLFTAACLLKQLRSRD